MKDSGFFCKACLKVTIIGDKAKLAEAVNQIWAEAVIAKGEERDGESKTRRNSGKTPEMG